MLNCSNNNRSSSSLTIRIYKLMWCVMHFTLNFCCRCWWVFVRGEKNACVIFSTHLVERFLFFSSLYLMECCFWKNVEHRIMEYFTFYYWSLSSAPTMHFPIFCFFWITKIWKSKAYIFKHFLAFITSTAPYR